MKGKIEKKNVEDIVSLTTVQMGILFHYLKESDKNLYNVQLSLNIEGDFNITLLEKAFCQVQSKNEALRSVFRWKELDRPVQVILKTCAVGLTIHDISTYQQQKVDKFVHEYLEKDQQGRFDLEMLPLRLSVLKTAATSFIFTITHHHILYDGWSTSILLEELFHCYRQLCRGEITELVARRPYKEIRLAIQNKTVSAKEENYWKEYLKNYEPLNIASGYEPLNIASGYESLNIASENASPTNEQWPLPKLSLKFATDRIESYARKQKVTKASLIYAVCGILFQKYYNVEDIVLGTAISGRDASIKGIDKVIGNFVNTIPVRMTNVDQLSPGQVIASMNNDLATRSDFQNTSYSAIKQWLQLKPENDLFDAVIVIENYPLNEVVINNSNEFTVRLKSVYENTGIPLLITAFFREDLEIEFAWDKNRMNKEGVASLAENFAAIMEAAISGSNKTVSSIPLIIRKEEQSLLERVNDTAAVYPDDKTIMDLFREQVQKVPRNVAIRTADEAVTYEELDRLSDKIASWLIVAQGAKTGNLVGLMLEREVYLIASIFGILKAGCAYVPIDPYYPVDRIHSIVEDAGLKLVITRDKYISGALKDRPLFMDLKDGPRLVDLDSERDAITAHPVDLTTVSITGTGLAYVIYTSGSTGKPKGVMIQHHSVINRLVWMQKQYPLNEADVLLQKTPVVFDVSVWELFWWSFTGASLYLLPPGAEKQPIEIINTIRSNNISTIHFVPSMLNAFLLVAEEEGSYNDLRNLRQVFASGEALKVEHLNLFGRSLHKYDGTALINLYGPTEATVDVSFYNCEFDKDISSVPIGKPIDNTRLYILNKDKLPVPIGVRGELYIAGVGLAVGYVGNKELTNEKFIQAAHLGEEKIYKTGDLATWLPDGNIAYLGRIDDQVKIRGHRIEPGEITSRLRELEGIQDAIVVASGIKGEKYLTAYYVAAPGMDVSSLKEHLSQRLPAYMLPTFFIELPAIPVNANGKLDKKSLPAPEFETSTAPSHVAATGEIEETLAKLWAEVLGYGNNISTHINFFDAGGDSIKVISLAGKIKKAFCKEVTIAELFSYPTIRSLGSYLSGGDKAPQKESHATEKEDRAIEKENHNIAIIGMSCRFPGAQDLDAYWDLLEKGEEVIVREESMDRGWVVAKGRMPDYDAFDAAFFGYQPSEAVSMDPQIRIFHECVWDGLEHAGYKPGMYEGVIGLYGGASVNPYYNVEIGTDEDVFEKWAAMSYADKDYLCTRISYKLNLKGPAISLSTACSTSLVAVDMACADLLLGKCSMAVAGGVSVTLHDNGGYKYHKGMILSSDGRCRAFDAQADGTVGGNGAGVVVLKKLEEALRDGDVIHAVIKGSATNNDGMEKVGFSAPGVNGQSRVVREALAKAKVSAESIGYIEAHGTGTSLGDPVEIAGLVKAFNTDRKQYCAIGSVKTNIGHLDTAAGIAGLIKTVLCLKHRSLVASLHYSNGNPNIDFANSPFYVNTAVRDWAAGSTPLRAGVSSFGIGGTNAHVIVEEAPQQPETAGSREYHLLVLSGKTAFSLQQNIRNLTAHLQKRPVGSLAGIAYTLQTCRERFSYRKTVVCRNRQETINRLSEMVAEPAETKGRDQPPMLVFMFPGQGAQYTNMCRDLYEKERAFRTTADECFDIILRLSGKDIKGLVLGHGSQTDPGELDDTANTQPALFVMEYALAQWLIKWGIRPSVMIGHSIGEYVAACISGVFTLEDGLRLVLRRGELMQSAKKGKMLSIGAGEEIVMPLLEDYKSISLAAVNSSEQCVVSGDEESILNFKEAAENKGFVCKMVRTSHAFHSWMMDDILISFEEAVSGVQLQAPRIPFISNLTGRQAENSNVCETAYWVNHLRREVRFSEGIKGLLEKENVLFIEVGPGQVLSSFVRSHRDRRRDQKAISLVRPAGNAGNDVSYLLTALGALWEQGVNIDWQGYYRDEPVGKVSLPGYAFERTRFAVLPAGTGNAQLPVQTRDAALPAQARDAALPDGRNPNIAEWFYTPEWKSVPVVDNDESAGNDTAFLIFSDTEGVSTALVQKLQQQKIPFILVNSGKGYIKKEDNIYEIHPDRGIHYEELFASLSERGVTFDNVLYAFTVRERAGSADTTITSLKTYNPDFFRLLYLLKAANRNRYLQRVHITLLTNNLQQVIGYEKIAVAPSSLIGLLKVIAQEYNGVSTCSIDISLPELPSAEPDLPSAEPDLTSAGFANLLWHSIKPAVNGAVMSLRNGRQWLQHFERVERKTEPPSGLRKEGVYLVTGGLGEMGFALAKYLLSKYHTKLILLGRAALMTDQASITDKTLADKLLKMSLLRQQPGEVLYLDCDVANEKSLSDAIEIAEKKFGAINGVIHAAGVTGGQSIQITDRLQEADFETQFHSKVIGLHTLYKVLGNKKIDFCIIASSISSALGGIRFGAYASANVTMDYYARFLQSRQLTSNWITVNFDGIAYDNEQEEGIKTSELHEVFERIVSLKSLHQVIVSIGNLEQRLKKWVFQDKGMTRAPAQALSNTGNDNNSSSDINAIIHQVTLLWQAYFGRNDIGEKDDFFEMGGDSLKALTMIGRIQKTFNLELSVSDFFDSPTIRQISERIYATRERTNTKDNPTFNELCKAPIAAWYPLSSAQSRLYFLYEFDRSSVAYNMPLLLSLKGNIDKEQLTKAVEGLIQRHESLRTSFEMVNGAPKQKIWDQFNFQIAQFSSTDYTKQGIQNFTRPFDLSKAPLIRVGLLEMDAQQHILLVDMPHIITDGISKNRLIKDFMSIYHNETLPEIPLQYKDFAVWQQGDACQKEMARQQEFWINQFSDGAPVLELPTDFTRPLVKSYEGHTISFELDSRTTKQLRLVAESENVTLFMLLLSAYNILLARLGNQEDLVIGTPVSGRQQADLENIIGVFLNTLPLRNHLRGDQTFAAFLSSVKSTTLAAFDNQSYPYEMLVDALKVPRDIGRNPLFEAMFSYENLDRRTLEIPGLAITTYTTENTVSKFDLTLTAVEENEKLLLHFEYCTSLFKKETIEKYVTYFRNIIGAIVTDLNSRIAEMDLLPEAESYLLLQLFNDTAGEYDRTATIVSLFEKRVAAMPDHIAVVYEDKYLTFKELNEQSNQLAHWLRDEYKIKANDLIGIMYERSERMIVVLMAILKSGAAFVPIDPAYPKERIAYILEDTRAHLLLVSKYPNLEFSYPGTVLLVDSDTGSHYSKEDPAPGSTPNDLCYLIYTSGSTGKPKGVMISNYNVINFFTGLNRQIPISNDDVMLAVTSTSFDIAILELFWTVCHGIELLIHPSDISMGGLNRYIPGQGLRPNRPVTMMQSTPSFVRQVSEDPGSDRFLKSLHTLLIGGEGLPLSLVNDLRKENRATIYNMYGPTETTIWSSMCRLGEDLERVSVGKPMLNTQLYILNKEMKLQPMGVTGDIYIGGEGVSRGYWNRPGLTAEKFIPNPFNKEKKMYKTGDLGRWLPDGTIEIIGREDYQVKINGYRVELGEIESILLWHEKISQAVVIAKERKGKYRVAYVVSEESLSAAALREYLGKSIPFYMIPAFFVGMEKLPLTPNGKINRNALPDPTVKEICEYKAPVNEMQERLVTIWSDLLKSDKASISVNRSFFDLGGNSLKATSLVNHIQKSFAVEVPIKEIFNRQTIESLADYLITEIQNNIIPAGTGLTDIRRAEEKDHYQLSFAQQRLYFLHKFDPGSLAYNVPQVLRLTGNIDRAKLEKVFKQLIDRHESLRTCFDLINGTPVQKIAAQVDFAIEYFYITEGETIAIEGEAIAVEGETIAIEGETTAVIRQFVRPFDLNMAPLIRIGLIEKVDGTNLLMVDMHHIVTDGVSVNVLSKDFMALYNNEILPALQIQYKDYAEWQQSNEQTDVRERQNKFWLSRFTDELNTPELPTDFQRPPIKSFNGSSVNFFLDAGMTKQLMIIANREDATLFMLLLSAFNILLSKLSNQEDITVGIPVAGRNNTGLENIIGMFVNTLPLRNYTDGNFTFRQFLGEVKANTLACLDNQTYPYEDLIDQLKLERETSRNPLFDVMFAYQNFERINLEIPGLALEPWYNNKTISKFDITLTAFEAVDGISLNMEYCTDLFKQATIDRFIDYFKRILSLVIADPDRRISAMQLATPVEHQQLIYGWNDTAIEYNGDWDIVSLIENRAQLHPENIALQLNGTTLSYRELDQLADQIAYYLQSAKAVKANDLVGVLLDREMYLLPCLLAIWKVGAAYVPIDTAYPPERVQGIVKDARLKVVITRDKFIRQLLEWETTVEIVDLDKELPVISNKELPEISKGNDDPMPAMRQGNQLAYVMYTSGSTGVPKGVMISHRSLFNYISWAAQEYTKGEKAGFALYTSISFDLTVTSLFLPLTTGNTLFIYPEKENNLLIEDVLTEDKATIIKLTPAHLRVICESKTLKNYKSSRFKRLIVGGEQLETSLALAIFKKLNGQVEIYNEYGPTEATVGCMIYRFDPSEELPAVPIGIPARNTSIYLLDKFLQPVAIGVRGELYISGEGVAEGYYLKEELTREKFIDNPFVEGKTMYRTGDLAVRHTNGNIVYRGRIDDQVKIRGYRIEVGEIESRLKMFTTIEDAVVIAAQMQDEKCLIGYYVAEKEIPAPVLRNFLTESLPDYMAPAWYVHLTSLPLTINGKLNKRALPQPEITAGDDYVAAAGDAEKELVQIWADLLSIDKEKISVRRSFFDLGGNSLKIIRLHAMINDRLHWQITIPELFRYPTIATLTGFMNQEKKGETKYDTSIQEELAAMQHLLGSF